MVWNVSSYVTFRWLKRCPKRQSIKNNSGVISRYPDPVISDITLYLFSHMYILYVLLIYMCQWLICDIFSLPQNTYGRPDEVVAAETLANHLRCNSSFIHEIFQVRSNENAVCVCFRVSGVYASICLLSSQLPSHLFVHFKSVTHISRGIEICRLVLVGEYWTVLNNPVCGTSCLYVFWKQYRMPAFRLAVPDC